MQRGRLSSFLSMSPRSTNNRISKQIGIIAVRHTIGNFGRVTKKPRIMSKKWTTVYWKIKIVHISEYLLVGIDFSNARKDITRIF